MLLCLDLPLSSKGFIDRSHKHAHTNFPTGDIVLWTMSHEIRFHERFTRKMLCPLISSSISRSRLYRTCRRYSSDVEPENRNYLIDPFEYSSNERVDEIPPLHVVPNSTAHPFCREIIRATGGNWVSQSTISYKSLFQPRCANVKIHPERITDRPMRTFPPYESLFTLRFQSNSPTYFVSIASISYPRLRNTE